MEIEGEDGSKTQLTKGIKRELGRGLGFDSSDRTVSRRQISFEIRRDERKTRPDSTPRVYFEVIGKNPIWVCSRPSDEIRVFRRWEGGEMEDGDMFCVSAKKPIWFTMKTLEVEGGDESGMSREVGNGNELAEELETSFGSNDVSNIDPVKEFGFLVMGHEFDHYPKQMICDAKTWNWFLEEPKEDTEDEEASNKKGTKRLTRKRKKVEDNDDDEWTGESEDDKELVTKSRKVQRPEYSTRSKDRDKLFKDTRSDKRSVQKKTISANGEDEEDEDDDTLGGFIVTGDDVEEEEEEAEIDEDTEEEEDYDEDDDEK